MTGPFSAWSDALSEDDGEIDGAEGAAAASGFVLGAHPESFGSVPVSMMALGARAYWDSPFEACIACDFACDTVGNSSISFGRSEVSDGFDVGR